VFGHPSQNRKITLDLIRHGEPEGGVRYRGSIDDPLSELGWRQMQNATGQAMDDGVQWDNIISSPMLRCVKFAQQLAHTQNLPLQEEQNLRELCFGELEGLTPQQAWQSHPKLLQNLWQNPEQHTPPGGELYTEFRNRVADALDSIVQHTPGDTILLVVHGGVIRAALSHFLNITPQDSFRIDVPYAGITRLKVYLDQDGSQNAALTFVNRYYGGKA
jgi:alpha-ribazole phosphatase